MRTYDGEGAQIDNRHGSVTSVVLNAAASGTYQVNPDCTGSSTIDVPGLPFPIETAFVIVNDGDEVQMR